MLDLEANQRFTEVNYSDNEHKMWQKLYSKQVNNLQNKANVNFLKKLESFELSRNRIPTLKEISDKMYSLTNWSVEPVAGIVGYEEYFDLLKKRKFPVATFIRSSSQEDLSIDPDIFHEVFGHCTMLLCPKYANFMFEYANFALAIPKYDRPLFARLIWFTTETGLLKTDCGERIFGASIMSSYRESKHCLESADTIKKPFNITNIMREPYRADILQNVYYVLDDLNQVYDMLNDTGNLISLTKKARELGEFSPPFPVIKNKYANIGHCIKLENTENFSA